MLRLVHPTRRLVNRFERVLGQALQGGPDAGGRLRIAVVGGGAGGTELALALAYRLTTELDARGRDTEGRPAIT